MFAYLAGGPARWCHSMEHTHFLAVARNSQPLTSPLICDCAGLTPYSKTESSPKRRLYFSQRHSGRRMFLPRRFGTSGCFCRCSRSPLRSVPRFVLSVGTARRQCLLRKDSAHGG